MKKTLTIFATLLRTFAEEIEALAEESAAAPAEMTAPPAKKRGRPSMSQTLPPEPATAVAPVTQEKTAEPVETEETKKAEVQGKTVEELRAMIEPVVRGGAGPQVKEVIKKYGCENVVQVSQKPEVHADFQKDIEAIVY